MAELKCPLMDKEVVDFCCDNNSIEQQVRDSYYITLLRQAYGHKIMLDGIVLGYYMLYFKEISLEEVNSIMGDEYESNMMEYYTAVHIRYLAIDKVYQHNGFGTMALQGFLKRILELSKNYPIRIITIDAIALFHEWYKKIGFRDIPGKKFDGIVYPMYVDCMSEEDFNRIADMQIV